MHIRAHRGGLSGLLLLVRDRWYWFDSADTLASYRLLRTNLITLCIAAGGGSSRCLSLVPLPWRRKNASLPWLQHTSTNLVTPGWELHRVSLLSSEQRSFCVRVDVVQWIVASLVADCAKLRMTHTLVADRRQHHCVHPRLRTCRRQSYCHGCNNRHRLEVTDYA
jgi:hypothetical protein